MPITPAPPIADAAQRVVLRTNDLCLSYGRFRVVDHLNIRVREGEIYGFLGRNGAGKTSTIRMLMGVIRADGGNIEMLGFRGRRIGVKQKQRIGYVSQEQFFYPWMTCRALGRFVSGFFPTWDQEEFGRLLQTLDLPPNRKVAHLSGGMKVKLALALALAHRPPILILDEPTSGLDPVARREFLEIISRQARAHQRTTFFSSHLIDEVERVADRVGIIHRGQLYYEGDIETLRTSVRRVRFAMHATPASPPTATASPVVRPANVQLEEPIVAELLDDDGAAPPLSTDDSANAASDPAIVPATSSDQHTLARRQFVQQVEERGYRVLRDDFDDPRALILYASPAHWDRDPFPSDAVSRLSLDDIFVALAGEAAPEL